MIINTNMPALNTVRQLGINEKATQSALAKLSSGFRINTAADDAAGLAISEKMRGQISGLNKAISNSQDGISMVGTAEGSLNETTSILQRMRELAVQGANDTNTTSDRLAIQTEMNQLTSEINRIGNTTEFNTQKLLKGTNAAVVTTAQTVATQTDGITGVAIGATSDLTATANSIVAISSNASVQGNTSEATGRVGLTDQTTVSVKGANSSIVVSGLNFTSTTLSSAAPNGLTININQLANTSGTASTVTTTGSGANTVVNFNIGTDASGKSLFTGDNRGELTNFLKGITGGVGYAGAGVTITVPEDPNANGPASAEKLINMPDRTQVATASTIYTGALTGGVTEVQGVSTFSIAAAIKEAGDTITVGGKTFTAVTSGANATKGEFNIGSIQASSKGDAAANLSIDLTAGGPTGLTQAKWSAVAISAAATAAGTSTFNFKGVTVTLNTAGLDATHTSNSGTVGAGATSTAVTVNTKVDAAATAAETLTAIIAGFNAAKSLGGSTGALANYTFSANGASLVITGNGSDGVGNGPTDAFTATLGAPTGLAGIATLANANVPGIVSTFDITVGADTYSLKNADLVKFNGTLTHDQARTIIKGATNTLGIALSTVADVSFDSSGKLNVIAKSDSTTPVTIAATSADSAKIHNVFGTTATTAVTAKATGATAANQAESLRVAINADATLGVHYTAAASVNALVPGEIMLTENATKADATTLAAVTTAGAGNNDKLNITDLAGKNLSQINIVKGTGVDIHGYAALSNKLDTSLQLTSGTNSAELNGVKVSFSGLSSSTTATTLTSSWDAATQTLNVTGSILAAETAAGFKTALQSEVGTALINAGFKGGVGLTVTAGAQGTAALISAALNGNSMTFGTSNVLRSNTVDGSMTATGAAGTEFDGVNIAFSGLTSTTATSLTSTWDSRTKTLTVSGTLDSTTLTTANLIKVALQTGIRTQLTNTGAFSAAGIAALTLADGASGGTVAAVAALNGKSITLNTGSGAATINAHAMAVDQKNGDLTITLSDTIANNNTAAKIQAAVQALATFKSSTGDVDFAKYQFTAEGNWDTKSTGENINKSNASLVGGTKEVKGVYTFDITTAFAVGDVVNVKGQLFTAVASGAIGSRNEFDVAGGDINNQAISLRNAIGLNSTLAATYTTNGSGATIQMTELQATGTDLTATDEKVTATGTPGQYSVDVSTLLTNGAAFELDGVKITASDDVANTGYADGTTFKAAADLPNQATALVDAINKNATLSAKYTASVDSATGAIVLDQTAAAASSDAPAVQTFSSAEGDFEATLQIGANTGQTMTVTIKDMRSLALGISGTDSGALITASNGVQASLTTVLSASNGSDNNNIEYTLDISDADKATAAISIIDDATAKVSAERSNLGAIQNRLEHTINNLGTSSQNVTTAEANIRDVDMAKEMTNFQKNNILQQAAQAMLAQANQQGQGVLQLLR